MIFPPLLDLFKSLDRAHDALNHSKNSGNEQNQRRNPECTPLWAVPSIIPPLHRAHGWHCVVICLFEDYEAVPPVVEAFDLALLGLERATEMEALVDEHY